MRINGIGVDLVNIPRMRDVIDRWRDRFLQRVFTEAEIAYCRARRDPVPHFAARFAAKEAGLKALGTGLRLGVSWRELEVRRERGQAPAPAGAGRVPAPRPAPAAGRTADIAADLGRRTGFGIVIATGFAIEPDTRERAGRRDQVNRPTEGVPGRPPAEEVPTDCAREVYDAYEARVREVARGPLRFLAEIHGNNHRDAAGRFEIATVGVDRELAFRLRALLELIRDAHLQGVAQAPRLDVLIEPADTLRYTASGANHCGILKSPERGLHIELPRRSEERRVGKECRSRWS